MTPALHVTAPPGRHGRGWALWETAALSLLLAYALVALPALVTGLSVYAELGTVRTGVSVPLVEHWQVLSSLPRAALLDMPVLEIDLAAGLPVARSFAMTLRQALLSLALAVLLAISMRRMRQGHLEPGWAALMIGAGLVAALSPGLLGHCVRPGETGGVLALTGLPDALVQRLSAISPFIQGGVMILLAWPLLARWVRTPLR